jgi:Zinc finger, C2H2 type
MAERSGQGQGQENRCSQCGQTFNSPNELREHQRTHKSGTGSGSEKNR